MKTGFFIPREDKLRFFKFFFTLRILLASLRLDSLMITFLLVLLATQWQSSTFDGSTTTFNSSKTFSTVPSRSSFFRDSGNPLISRHSRLEYWLLLQHCRSKDTTLSLSFELIFLVIARSTSTFFESVLKLLMSLSVLAKVEVNLFWYSSDRLTSSSLVSLSSASSERYIFDHKSVTLLQSATSLL